MWAISPISGASLNGMTTLLSDAEVAYHAEWLVALIDARVPNLRYANTCKKRKGLRTVRRRVR